MARTIARIPEPRLMGEMNVTPFIDVMLVLLIVMILSIPIATHKVPIDLPGGDPFNPSLPPTLHKLAIDRNGALHWDGAAITDAALPATLATMQKDPQAELHVQTDPEAPYARFDATLAMVKRAGVTKLGFVGNESMRDAF